MNRLSSARTHFHTGLHAVTVVNAHSGCEELAHGLWAQSKRKGQKCQFGKSGLKSTFVGSYLLVNSLEVH